MGKCLKNCLYQYAFNLKRNSAIFETSKRFVRLICCCCCGKNCLFICPVEHTFSVAVVLNEADGKNCFHFCSLSVSFRALCCVQSQKEKKCNPHWNFPFSFLLFILPPNLIQSGARYDFQVNENRAGPVQLGLVDSRIRFRSSVCGGDKFECRFGKSPSSSSSTGKVTVGLQANVSSNKSKSSNLITKSHFNEWPSLVSKLCFLHSRLSIR